MSVSREKKIVGRIVITKQFVKYCHRNIQSWDRKIPRKT